MNNQMFNNIDNKTIDDWDFFYKLGLTTIKELEIPGGILASSGEEIFGCIFGRDSLITCLKLLQAYKLDPSPYYLDLTKKVLTGLLDLLGKEINIESGEEPGKCIHEFRATGHERLTKTATPPWFKYPDNTMRNFDSIDSTPLLLIALYRYYQRSGDIDFIKTNEQNIKLSLAWIINYGDKNRDGFIDYERHPHRKGGGLTVHSWMDSSEALFHEDDVNVSFPIAPIEAQAYVYLAFKLWSIYFLKRNKKIAIDLEARAIKLKRLFNEKFILGKPKRLIFVHALDNSEKHLISVRSNIGHVLWACLNPFDDGTKDCILENKYINPLAKRLMKPDIYEPEAGIRTLSKKSRAYDSISYHNGSIWPHDNSLISEGMENLGFKKNARDIRISIFKAYSHFRTPVELFSFDNGEYKQYKSVSGQIACHQQAWTAASMIADSLALKSTEIHL